MNILLINWQDPANSFAGGAEIHLFEIFRRVASWGHRVRLVCSGWPGAPVRDVMDGIEIIRVGGRHSFAVRGRGAIRNALGDESPDVLVEDINKVPLFTASLAPEVPCCVIVPHLFGTTAFQQVSWPMALMVWLAEQPIPWAYRRADFHAISESTRDDLILRGIPPERIRVIHPGVDLEHYAPDPGLDRTPQPTFLYVGRLVRYKGLQVAIEALARVRQTRADVTLRIAGGGTDLPRLQRIASDRGVRDAVDFLGFVSDAEKVRLFRTSWANIFPSPKEGWGLTVIEAAACGTASLASDSPGLRDSVRHGDTGLLVPHGDAEALAEHMLMLANDQALATRLGSAARQYAATLDWDHVAKATLSHLEELVAARRSRLSHPRGDHAHNH